MRRIGLLSLMALTCAAWLVAVGPRDAQARPKHARSAKPIENRRTKPSSGAERRQTLKRTGRDVGGRFRALGRSFRKLGKSR